MTGDDLFSPRRFAEAIDRIARRRLASCSARTLQEGGVCFATIHEQRDTVARLLVNDLLADRLPAAPGRMYRMEKDGKERQLYDFPVIELIIHDAVAQWLAEKASPHLSPQLYSYRTGISYHRAVRDFGRYVRVHRRERSDTSGGLYVLRRDVRAYFDSIPVHDEAPLWAIVAEVIEPVRPAGLTLTLIRRALRPRLIDSRGIAYRLSSGIPTGSPAANVVANLYLRGMDQELSSVHGAFYARYGDDMLAAHPDPGAACALSRMLATHLRVRGLELSPKKTHDLYLTIPGRQGTQSMTAQPAVAVEFLGHRISARGAISLSLQKTRTLLDELRTRASYAARIGARDPEARIARAVHAMNRLLDAQDAAAHPYAKLLRTTVTDRLYLRWLDHELGLIALEAALGRKSPRHFRSFPPRTLRDRFGLRSLVVARNRIGLGS